MPSHPPKMVTAEVVPVSSTRNLSTSWKVSDTPASDTPKMYASSCCNHPSLILKRVITRNWSSRVTTASLPALSRSSCLFPRSQHTFRWGFSPALRPAGSDPEVVCQKILFWKLVFLGWVWPFCCPWKTFCETTLWSSYEKQGRNLRSPWRHWAPFVRPLKGLGIKIDVWGNPVVYASTGDWSSLYGAIRSEPETVAQSSCSHFWVSLGTPTLSLFCMHRSGCSYCDASGEFCLPYLRVLSFSA